jgi:PAS domain S-box-containing protein
MDAPTPASDNPGNDLLGLRATLQKLEEENAALRKSRDDSQRREQRFRLITENTLDLICEVSQHGVYTYVSPNHREILGYRARDLLGLNFAALIHEDDVAPVVDQFSECIVSNIPFVASFRLRHRDGGWRWVEVSAKPLAAVTAPGARPYEGQAIFVYRDVTERRQTQRALFTEAERLKVTLASIADGVISTDLAGGIVEINEAALQLTGLKEEELAGTPLSDHIEFLDEMTRQAVRSPVIRALTEGVPCNLPLSGHTLLRTKAGVEFAVAGAAAPIRDQHELAGAVLIFRNITERRRTEQELLKLSKQESLGQLAGRIAHDFNNLLTVILGNLSLTKILLDPGDAAMRRLADTEKACLRAKDLTRQLLAFARGGVPVKKPVTLEPIVRESTRLILQDSSVAYKLTWPEPLPAVNADAEQLHQLLYELLTNATQASPAGGTIHIRGESAEIEDGSPIPLAPGQYVRLSVRDEGLGIPEPHLPRIFEPFFTTKENARGLGLATCFLIARNHEGFITVDSAPGEGAAFSLYLPVQVAPAAALDAQDAPWTPPPAPRRVSTIDESNGAAAAPLPSLIRRGQACRVLVMDDEAPICELAAELLSREGYEVGTASDGEDAIRQYAAAKELGHPYDVVILDLTVRGGLGGRAALTGLAEIDPDVRAIVSSGYSQDPIMSRYREFGFCGVVSKPYSVSELSHEIEQAIASGRN